jgi:RNA polymerase sigma-70 factor (ECF subfamily)
MAQPGGQRALQRLVEDHYTALYRYAYRLSGSPDEAGDLTQETFCKAHAQFGQLRNPERAKAWLYSILRNAYLHRVRESNHRRCVSLDQIGEVPVEMPDNLPEIEPARLQDALNDLPEGFRTPLILFYFDEFSYRDIAEQLDLPIGTVMSRLARGKAYLRERLCPPATEGGRRPVNGM